MRYSAWCGRVWAVAALCVALGLAAFADRDERFDFDTYGYPFYIYRHYAFPDYVGGRPWYAEPYYETEPYYFEYYRYSGSPYYPGPTYFRRYYPYNYVDPFYRGYRYGPERRYHEPRYWLRTSPDLIPRGGPRR